MKTKKTILAIVAGAVISASSYAATTDTTVEGNSSGLGASSNSSLEVKLGVPKWGVDDDGRVLIKHLDDIDLGVLGVDAKLKGQSNFCIYATGYAGPLGKYADPISVQIGGGDGTKAFILTGENDLVTVPYEVRYLAAVGVNGATGAVAATAGGKYSFAELGNVGLDAANSCTAENASIHVSVKNTDASVLPQDTYVGTLALVIAAN